MYDCQHFTIEELVPMHVFHKYGGKLALRMIDERVLITLDQLRTYFGMCIINDWNWGGSYHESGYRDADCEHYSPTSMHSFGRAMDCKFSFATAEEVRESVIEKKILFPHITFIEDGVSWFHFDVRNGQRIQLWHPETHETTFV